VPAKPACIQARQFGLRKNTPVPAVNPLAAAGNGLAPSPGRPFPVLEFPVIFTSRRVSAGGASIAPLIAGTTKEWLHRCHKTAPPFAPVVTLDERIIRRRSTWLN
jgi:hypothetical protein